MIINNQEDARMILKNMNHNDLLRYGYQSISKFQHDPDESAHFNTSCNVLGGPKRSNLSLDQAAEILLEDKEYFNKHNPHVEGNFHAFI